MTQPSNDDATGNGGGAPKLFTQEQVDRIVRDRIAREREKYADYDELKARAAEADKSKSAIERIEAKLDEAEKRAAKAEDANLRREVADELGLSPKQARRLTGKTREELLADGREMIEDYGIKPKGAGASDGKSDEPQDDDQKQKQESTPDDTDRQPRPRRQRPVEDLQSGAPATRPEPEETDPLKLAAGVRRF